MMDSEPKIKQEKKKEGWIVTPEGHYDFYNKKGILELRNLTNGTKIFYEPNGNVHARLLPQGIIERFKDGVMFSREAQEKADPLEPSEEEVKFLTLADIREKIARNEKIVADAEEELREVEERIAAARAEEASLGNMDKKLRDNWAKLAIAYDKIDEKFNELREVSPFNLIKHKRLRKELNDLKKEWEKLSKDRVLLQGEPEKDKL